VNSKNPALLCAVVLASSLAASSARAKDAPVSFTKDVQPILKESCLKCHGLDPAKPKKKAAAKLRLDDKDAALKGGEHGKAIIPGDAKGSLLYKLLSGPVASPDPDDEDQDIDPMPKAKKGEKWKPLPDDQIETIKKWIDQGAKWEG
jgi:hypothetical protein